MRLAPILLIFLSLFALAETDNHGKELYLRAVKGDRDAATEAAKLFSERIRADSGDTTALAYLGSLRILESGRTMAVWKKGRLAKEGLTALDEAVSRAPENLEVRYLRAVSTWHLPSVFGREEQCAADLAWLSERAEAAAVAGTFDPRYSASAMAYHRRMMERRRR